LLARKKATTHGQLIKANMGTPTKRSMLER